MASTHKNQPQKAYQTADSTAMQQLYSLAVNHGIRFDGASIVTQELISSLKLIAGNVDGIPKWATDVELICFYLDGKCLTYEPYHLWVIEA